MMNKQQLRSCLSYPGTQNALVPEYCASPPPEISIFPAPKQFEIDEHTGLPKLPVELPVPGSPETPRFQLASALKMSTNDSSTQRKSVTFEPASEQEASPKLTHSLANMSKQTSDISVTLRDQAKQPKRTNGRPTSLPNRSRSVFIRLQPPRSTPTTLTHKRSAGNAPLSPVETDAENAKAEHADAASPRWSSGRRSSFLYQSASGDPREEEGRFLGGEDYVTPFAQILSTLHRVRADYLALVGLPEDTKTLYTRHTSASTGSPPETRKFPKVPEEKEAMEVLKELDWSLKMLETVNANQSMANVTGDKIKRMLNRELSHLSEGSESGAQVAEWVTNITSSDPYEVNRMTSTRTCVVPDNNTMETSLSASCSHDNWTRRKCQEKSQRRITMEAESVPRFGVDIEESKKKELDEYIGNKKLFCWNVDVFHFDTLTSGNSLVSATYLLFKKRNLFSELHVSPHTFINYMTHIQNSYHSTNPYHNAMHAADVCLTTNQLISADTLEGVFSPVEIMAALVAAAVHDVDHPGVSNPYLVAIRHELAVMYNDNSVLENHHVATAFRTLQQPKCNFLEYLDADCVQLFRRAVIDMVLSTDMAKHIDNVGAMKTLIETKKLTNDGLLTLGNYKENSAVLKCMIHCADLSNPAKDPTLASNWSYRIMEESFRQGDREKELGIAMHSMGDRDTVNIPKCQTSFIDFVIYPLWETWAELVYPDAQHIMDNLTATKAYWCDLVDKKMDTVLPGSPKILEDIGGDGPRKILEDSGSRSSDEGEGENNSLTPSSSIDSTTQEEFKHSPACERRSSYRTMKNSAINQGLSSSVRDS